LMTRREVPAGDSLPMTNVPSEADRFRDAGRKQILRACLLSGGPLLTTLVLAGLQYAGAVRLDEYFVAEPDKVDQRLIFLGLAVLALLLLLFGATGVLGGWVLIRRAKRLR
jgi:hypothetical protein